MVYRFQVLSFAVGVLCLPQTVAVAQEQGAPNLPEIGRVQSRAYCTAFRQVIAPIVGGLMKTDELIGVSRGVLQSMARDDSGSDPVQNHQTDFERMQLGVILSRAANNQLITDRLLNDASHTKTTSTADNALLSTLSAQIRAVSSKQAQALNTVNNLYETELMGQMRKDVSTQMASSTGPIGAKDKSPKTFVGAAGLQMPAPIAVLDPRTRYEGTTTRHNVYSTVAQDLAVHQSRISSAEKDLSVAVVAAAAECGGATPRPSPSP